MQIDHLRIGILGEDLVPHCVHQVRLAKAHTAVQQQRVVRQSGILRNLLCGRLSDLVRFSFDECFEREHAVQIDRTATGRFSS